MSNEIVISTECPECGSTDILVSFGMTPSFSLGIHGQWAFPDCMPPENFDWRNAEYECEKCSNEWVAEQG